MGLGIGVGFGVSFGLVSPLLRRLRVFFSSVRDMGWFWTCRLAVVSVYLIVGSRDALVSDVPTGGGFVISYRWFALCVGSGRFLGGGFVSRMLVRVWRRPPAEKTDF